MTRYLIPRKPPKDYGRRIRKIRLDLGLTQVALAERLGVSFVTINRWENEQSKPSQLSWNLLRQFEESIAEAKPQYDSPEPAGEPGLDFTARPEVVKLLAEGERLSFGHLANPTFATEISRIDPLPHQRIAVYDFMLKQPQLRFLLADDAGAGKTIMAGLYIREMVSRRLIRRILIVVPAGLIGNWHREILSLFHMPFRTVDGVDARRENPFVGEESDRLIVSIDTLAGEATFARLRESGVAPYDLVIFDEAHKLSAARGSDLRVTKTDRYRLAESLAGIESEDRRWRLGWSAHHLLLLTATPHMGKDYPYYALWRLLQPGVLSTPEAFQEYPPDHRRDHFIRRTKEEMVHLDGRLLYPRRVTATLGYDLTQGEVSEQKLYDETTDYLRFMYNRAKLLNREAARLAMSVFQRRLASSTFALMRSFERRIEKIDRLIVDMQMGNITPEQLATYQQRIREDDDTLDTLTADEEATVDGREQNQIGEDNLLEGVVATSIAELQAERGQVEQLLALAGHVCSASPGSKFGRLREALSDPEYASDKMIVFTEHRDTLDFLVRQLGALGYADQITHIHGGMDYKERDKEVLRFRRPLTEGGARFMVCTDAAGEGINLQFCHLMINYDIPWNPARLEQRMGRIHRYGQKHDPVLIMNLVAPRTREGRVLQTLLTKLEKIRDELSTEKVFDCIGRIFGDVSIKRYMELALAEGAERAASELDSKLTPDEVRAVERRESKLYGGAGDVANELPRLRAGMDREVYFRLLPGYVRHYLERACPLVDIEIEGDPDSVFSLKSMRVGAMDALLPVLESYPEDVRERFTVQRPADQNHVVWLHPGEPVFERLRALVGERLGHEGRRGGVFLDPSGGKPYFFHLALVSVLRTSDPQIDQLRDEELLECRLVGVKQEEGGRLSVCPIEHLLLLRGAGGLPNSGQRLALGAAAAIGDARTYLNEHVAREMASRRKLQVLESLAEREAFLLRGFDYQEADLAARRAKHSGKARSGNRRAADAIEEVKREQHSLADRRDRMLSELKREPELITAGPVQFVAHALVVPSAVHADAEDHDIHVESLAMQVVRAYEESGGARVQDVHRPDLARAAGLPDNPGFDLLSVRANGERRAIEVKGRAGIGDVEVSANEWAKACNLRDSYWLYAVFDCASPLPRLFPVQDPFGKLLARGKGSLLVGASAITSLVREAIPMEVPANEALPAFLRELFWDTDFNSLDWGRDRDFIVRRALQVGAEDAEDWVRMMLTDSGLSSWISSNAGGGLEPRRLRYWQVILDLDSRQVDVWVARARSEPWEMRHDAGVS